MAKYDALRLYLASRPGEEERMSFGEVEQLVGRLPDSAREHRAWWGNDDYKSQSIAWRDAGWHVESVDQRAGTVVFARGATGSTPRIVSAKFSARSAYIDAQVIAAIKAKGGSDRFDRTKLLRLIEELNDNYLRGNGYAAHALLRPILDHVPPLLSCAGFAAAVNSCWTSRCKLTTRCTGRYQPRRICSTWTTCLQGLGSTGYCKESANSADCR